MNKTNKILVAVVIVLLLLIVGIFTWKEWFSTSSLYAVYLRTGDLYFGKLVRFPYFGLRQVYLIQVNRDNPQAPLSIQKFANIFWGPEDYLKINRDEVVWMTKLKPDGQLAQLIKSNPGLAQPQATVPGNQQQPAQKPSGVQ